MQNLKILYPLRWVSMVGLLIFCVGCSGLAKKPIVEPNVQVRNFEITGLSLAGVEGIVTLDVENPNETKLSAKELNYAVAVAGNELVAGQSTDNISIPALGTDTVELPVEMSFAKLIEAFPKIMKSGLANYVITGNIKTNFATVPFTKKGEFKLPFSPAQLKEIQI